MKPDLLPRLVAPYLDRAAGVMPVVVLTGARQTGKSTLARGFRAEDAETPGARHRYVTLDDLATAALARRDPDAFVRQAEALIIDEVQREPDLLLAIKSTVDTDHPRRPGRFVLTGSADLALLAGVRESLAGRAAYVTLHPLTRREQLGFGSAGIWSELLATDVRGWRDLILGQAAPEEDWRDLARRGGYPTPAYQLAGEESRRVWFDGYLRTYLQRDVPEISAIENIPGFDTILRSVALRTGTMVNQTQLAREASIPQSTVQRYVAVLEASYLVHRLPAYVASRTKQLVKSPKSYWGDAGLALFLSREKQPRGEHFENIVATDLLAWQGAQPDPPHVFYWRTQKGHEVDFVLQDGPRLLPIELKTTSNPSTRELASMQVFLSDYADRTRGGLLLHTGEQTFWIAKDVLATPWWRVI